MSLLQIVFKQMRERALGTWLTLLSVVLGVALAVALLVLDREGEALFGQTGYGFDVIVGPKGSQTQLVLNTVYGLDAAQGTIPWRVYEDLLERDRPYVRAAVPFAVGDTYQGMRIVGTLTTLFGTDDRGRPLEGYDEQGRLLDGYVLPTDENADDEDVQRAAWTVRPRPDRQFVLAEGRVFHPYKFEAVIGSEVPDLTDLSMDAQLTASHGGDHGHVHEEKWDVVGVLEPTGTAFDRAIFVSLVSFIAIDEHAETTQQQAEAAERMAIAQRARDGEPLVTTELDLAGLTGAHDDHDHDHDHEAHDDHAGHGHDEHAHEDHDDHDGHDHHDHSGHDHGHGHGHDHDHHHHGRYGLVAGDIIDLDLPQRDWLVSGVLVVARGGFAAQTLYYNYRAGPDAMAALPGPVMGQVFERFIEPSSMTLQGLAWLVTVVAVLGILVSIYNSVSARRQEIAVLRALGATRGKILTLVCGEAVLIGLGGAVIGVVVGHLIAGAGSVLLDRLLGEGFAIFSIGSAELLYGLVVVLAALLAGLVPAIKAYNTPVATHLDA